MLVLGIESSCDECSLALVWKGTQIVGMQTYSQVAKHKKYSGVVPELASRLHVKHIVELYQRLLRESDVQARDIEGIAVTKQPGLRGSLMVGMQFAKGLALALALPFAGIDHIEAHIYSPQLETPIAYPHLFCVLSGGHSVLGIAHDFNRLEVRGVTVDDACGEAFDKIARELGFDYPGAAQLDLCAEKGDSNAASFPRHAFRQHGYNLSYSGLKTAVIHHRDKYWNPAYPQSRENIAAAFRYAAIEIVLERVAALAEETGIRTIAFGGGVSQNRYLQRKFTRHATIKAVFPRTELCMDNAAMIAGLGYWYLCASGSDSLILPVSSRNVNFRYHAT